MITVTFIGDYFALSTATVTPNEFDRDEVINQAASFIEGCYGWDVLGASNEIEVEI